MNNRNTFGPQDTHKNGTLLELFKILLGRQGAHYLPMEHEVNVDIGYADELFGELSRVARESRLRRVLYSGLGFIPFSPDKAMGDNDEQRELSHYLAFTVGEFSPPENPYEVGGEVLLERFNRYSNLFATIITRPQFEVFTGEVKIELPRDGSAVWDPRCAEYTGENAFASIFRQAAAYRERSAPYRMLFEVDTLEGSIAICDHNGNLHHLPQNFKHRREISLDSGISLLTAKKLARGQTVPDKVVIENLMEDDLMNGRRFLNPVPLKDLGRRKIYLGGEGPDGYSSWSGRTDGVAPGLRSRPGKRLGF